MKLIPSKAVFCHQVDETGCWEDGSQEEGGGRDEAIRDEWLEGKAVLSAGAGRTAVHALSPQNPLPALQLIFFLEGEECLSSKVECKSEVSFANPKRHSNDKTKPAHRLFALMYIRSITCSAFFSHTPSSH